MEPKMFSLYVLFLVLSSSGTFSCETTTPVPNHIHHPGPPESYEFHEILDNEGEFHLFWNVNQTHITFEIHAKTWGYVGFGLSTNGKMFPADVVVGWVKDGTAFLSDRHTHGHFEPHIDDSQDWILLHGEEDDFGTVLKMTRKLDTCDEDDFIITDSTVKGIYAYHADDPEDGHPLYHGGEKRGAKNLMLMNKMKNPDLPEDVQTIDFLNHQQLVPDKGTTYLCKVFSLKHLGKKHHMVKFAPVIQEGHYSIVHHMLVYKCPAVEAKYEGTTYECYEVHNRDLSPCRQVFLGWEVGGGEFYFPENVGMPIGEEDDNSMFIMETHYNNPQRRMDYVDNSGIRIWYTPTLRQHDSGLLMAGVSVSPNQIIPPHMEHFLSSGFCTEECLNKGLNEFGEKGVTVYAIWQHGHLLARRITTRLIRNGVEQPPLADDKNFDFNYQDYRHLHKYRTLKSGDSLLTECHYNSMGKNVTTHGGISTRQEMCISFIFYYPRMVLDSCETFPNYQTWDTKGEDKALFADKMDWTQKHNRDVFLQKLNESTFTEYCHGERLSPKWQTNQVGTLLQPKVSYQEPSSKCSKPTISQPTTHPPYPTPTGTSHKVHPIPTENYAFHEIMDDSGDYHLYWNVNKTHVTFETHVRTWGYVAFGFSTNGKMFPADVVIGWIKNGKTYFSDRHTTGHYAPIKDKSQDWFLLHGEENNFGTLLKMVRKLDTCDKDDFVITDSTIKGIYAYGPQDPEDEEYPPYHGSVNRGAKNLMLLNKMANPEMPNDVQTIDFLNHQQLVPDKGTTYLCKVFSLRHLKKKHHMIKFAPVIQAGHYPIVHHILVYKCPAVDPKYEGTTYECYEVHNRDLSPCRQVFLGWEVGGGAFYFPENVGMPIGEPDDASMFVMETHYNNPEKRMDYVDNSGIRIWYTPTLREHDSGLLMAGVSVSPYQIIPPYMDHFLSSGFCTGKCLNKGLKQFGEKGVTVYAIWQHGHLLARRITTRLIRNGVEQPPLADDKTFDFNYQDYRHLHNYRTLKSGDSLITECHYNSSRKNVTTHGGISTRQEMCISFIFYYPRMVLDSCETFPNYQTWDTKGEDKALFADKMDWTQKYNKDMFLQKLNDSTFTEICHGERLSPKWQHDDVGTILKPKVQYNPPPSSCHNNTDNVLLSHQTGYMLEKFLGMPLLGKR